MELVNRGFCDIVILLCWLGLAACNEDDSVKTDRSQPADTLNTDTLASDTVKQQVLVFSRTAGYHHASIAVGNRALVQLGEKNNLVVVTTADAAYFNNDSLEEYFAVVFLSTTGDVLNQDQQAAFEWYIRSGGGYVGIHAASDTEYEWPWYGRLVGGYFNGHPPVQDAVLQILNHDHPATGHLDATWSKRDEWYNFRDMNDAVDVLINVNEHTYEGGTMGSSHPVSWYHQYDGGRAFYTALGHTEESFSDPLFLDHVLGGIEYVMGE